MINKGNHNNKVRNVDEILNKIKEKKRIEFANDIKKHLFPMEKDMQNNNISYMQFREFYSLYFQLFTSILGNSISKSWLFPSV